MVGVARLTFLQMARLTTARSDEGPEAETSVLQQSPQTAAGVMQSTRAASWSSRHCTILGGSTMPAKLSSTVGVTAEIRVSLGVDIREKLGQCLLNRRFVHGLAATRSLGDVAPGAGPDRGLQGRGRSAGDGGHHDLDSGDRTPIRDSGISKNTR